jgi:hypothetical protein
MQAGNQALVNGDANGIQSTLSLLAGFDDHIKSRLAA